MPSQLPIEGQFPSLAGATGWLNSSPLTAQVSARVGRAGPNSRTYSGIKPGAGDLSPMCAPGLRSTRVRAS